MADNPYSIQTAAIQKMYDDSVAQYRAAQAAAEEVQNKRIQQAVNELEGQRPGITQQYNDAAQQAYINNMLQQRDLPQRMAALGLTGGASESSLVRMNNQYGNNLNNLTTQYNNDINALDRAIANARLQGEAQLGDIRNKYSLQLAEAQRDYNDRLANAQMQLQMWELENAAKQAAAARSSGGSGGSGSGSSATGAGTGGAVSLDSLADTLANEKENAGNQYTLSTSDQYRNYLNPNSRYQTAGYSSNAASASNQYPNVGYVYKTDASNQYNPGQNFNYSRYLASRR